MELTRRPRLAWAMLMALTLGTPPARALELEVVPESRHQQHQTFALFTEDYSSVLFKNQHRAWAAIAGGIALVEWKDAAWTPQLVAFGGAFVNFRLNERGDTVLTETVDAKAGLRVEMALTPTTRFSLGWTHYSGHIGDDVRDAELIGPNLGDEQLQARFVADLAERFRVGASLKPIIGSDPGLKLFAADQFVEWYPIRVSDDYHRPTPYVAFGVEEYGRHEVEPSYHAQVGAFIGNHTRPEHKPSVRAAIGYYSGTDPSLKYAQFKESKVKFAYLGLLIGL